MAATEQPSGSCPPSEEPSTKSETGTTSSSGASKQIKREISSLSLPAAATPDTAWAFGMPSTDLERTIDRLVLSTDPVEQKRGEHLRSMLSKHNAEIENAADLSQDAEMSELYQLNTQARQRVDEAREVGTRLRDSLKKMTEALDVQNRVVLNAAETLKTAQAALTDVDKMMDELDSIEEVLREDEEYKESEK